jgi:hypothetical protein
MSRPCFQAEDDDGPVGRTPGGMHVVILPYASEVREAPLDVGHASEEQVLAAEQIVNALQLEEFDCRDFPNPGEKGGGGGPNPSPTARKGPRQPDT